MPVETPLQSQDRRQRASAACWWRASSPTSGEADVDLGSGDRRACCRTSSAPTPSCRCWSPTARRCTTRSRRCSRSWARAASYTKQEKEQYKLEADRVLQDAEFWRKVGEEFQNPLIVTGRVGFEAQNRSGFQSEERVVRDPGTNRPRLVRGNRYLERKGFSLTADFHFVDGRTGQTLHKEKFTEEVLYGEEQKISPLSSYFELMDRLLPNFLGVISPQKIRGTRVLLR